MRSPIPKTKPPHDGMDREPVSNTASFMSLWRKAAGQFRRTYCRSDLRHQKGHRYGGQSGDLSYRPFFGGTGTGRVRSAATESTPLMRWHSWRARLFRWRRALRTPRLLPLHRLAGFLIPALGRVALATVGLAFPNAAQTGRVDLPPARSVTRDKKTPGSEPGARRWGQCKDLSLSKKIDAESTNRIKTPRRLGRGSSGRWRIVCIRPRITGIRLNKYKEISHKHPKERLSRRPNERAAAHMPLTQP